MSSSISNQTRRAMSYFQAKGTQSIESQKKMDSVSSTTILLVTMTMHTSIESQNLSSLHSQLSSADNRKLVNRVYREQRESRGIDQCPIHLAVSLACKKPYSPLKNTIVFILLEASANPCQEDEEGRTPLHLAAQNEHRTMVEILFMAGGSINLSSPHLLTSEQLNILAEPHQKLLTILDESTPLAFALIQTVLLYL